MVEKLTLILTIFYVIDKMIIDSEFKDEIRNDVKKSSKKEDIYNYIDKMENFDQYLRYYNFHDLLKDYAPDSKTSSDKYNYEKLAKKKIETSLLNLFKEAKNTDFISDPDLKLLNEYITAIANCINPGYCYAYSHFSEIKLNNKIGFEKFSSWKLTWNPDSIRAAISEVVNEEIAKQDSHRYSEEAVQCFIDAAKTDDFQEAASNCQYAMHVIGVNHNNDATEL